MAAPAPLHSKRKAPTQLPSGVQVVDLTLEDDDNQPAPKRQRSHLTEQYNSLPTRARDHTLSTNHPSSQNGLGKQEANDDSPVTTGRKASTPPTLTPAPLSAKKSPFQNIPEWSVSAQIAKLSGTRQEQQPNGTDRGLTEQSPFMLKSAASPAISILAGHPNALAMNIPERGSENRKLKHSPSPKTELKSDLGSNEALEPFRLPKISAIRFDAHLPAIRSPSALNTKPINHRQNMSHRARDNDKGRGDFISPRPSSPSVSTQNEDRIHLSIGDMLQRRSPREVKTPDISAIENCSPFATPRRTPQPQIDELRLSQKMKGVFITESQPSQSPLSSRDILKAFSGQVPDPDKERIKKEQLLHQIKIDMKIATSRAASIERHFGPTGFSEAFSTTNDTTRLKKKLQPKAKSAKRKKSELNWAPKQPTSEFRHQDLVHPKAYLKQISKPVATLSSPSQAPLTFVNDVDDRQLSGKFQFISKYVFRDGITVKASAPQKASQIGCSITCINSCSPHTCGCLLNNRLPRPPNAYHGPVYRQHSNGLTVLAREFLEKQDQLVRSKNREDHLAQSEIIECNQQCLCGETCVNRVVQRGRTLPLEIFMTKNCGFGLRSSQNIVRGQFIDLYLGELITGKTLEAREDAREHGESSYLFQLDWFKQDLLIYHIDGANFGNASRFVNHSCNANCKTFQVILNPQDERIYGIGFFAIKDIPAMTEITLDYAPRYGEEGEAEEHDADESGPERLECHCGEANCRGWLWPTTASKSRAVERS